MSRIYFREFDSKEDYREGQLLNLGAMADRRVHLRIELGDQVIDLALPESLVPVMIQSLEGSHSILKAGAT